MDYEITPEELKSLLDEQRRRRGARCARAVGVSRRRSIAGSKHIPMGDIPARFNQELDPEEHIVVVCHHGVRSMNVTAWLRQQGFEKVQSLRGGIDRWAREIDPRCRCTNSST